MYKYLLTLLLLTLGGATFANHIKGGFFTYKYLGESADGSRVRYNVKLTVYMGCNPNPGQLNQVINFSFFDGASRAFVRNESVSMSPPYDLGKKVDEKCITGDQSGCYYTIVEYELASVELPANPAGYIVSYQRCCRIANVDNIIASSTVGNTYSIQIPGKTAGSDAYKNKSATFDVNDTAVVCSNSFFTTNFSALDPDGDELRYSFCDAWVGGSQVDPAPETAANPPYGVVSYSGGFSGSQPLGSNVKIDPVTGVISGTAPGISMTGEFVITVCVSEIRNGKVIATTRKELHIRVAPCTPIKAVLEPEYPTCDGFTRSFSNNSPSVEIKTHYWDFGDGNFSTDERPTHTYADTGVYNLKLVVNRNDLCSDSTTALVKVFPGFFPGFSFAGVCINKPTQFTDTTKTAYGFVNSWKWDFGDGQSTTDNSTEQNPVYTYSNMGTYRVQLIATSSKGCIDTVVYNDVSILDKPPLSVAFADTLICNGDNVQLEAIGNGIFSWTPVANITGENTATPIVRPNTTAKYVVELNDNGCLARDTVQVRVVNEVTLQMWRDTTICATDPALLGAQTDALKFEWSPVGNIDNPAAPFPTARPAVTTTYQLRASIGSCVATDEMTVFADPYPIANAGADTVLCFQNAAQLAGSITGADFRWTPTQSLINPNSLNTGTQPLASSVAYVLTAIGNKGCPKEVSDTVLVNVLPEINGFAGRDTAVVAGQLLQFNATGGVGYLWTPATNLSNPNIANPTATYSGTPENFSYTVYVSNEVGCVDSATVAVRVFRTEPQVFVPTAFTPNADGKNDLFKPIPVGMTRIEYFRVYNRWGQLVYSNNGNDGGWDGRINGKLQATGTYAWLVKGTDFSGKEFFAKGTMTLIR
jgi:gliding motility-associated-like protein